MNVRSLTLDDVDRESPRCRDLPLDDSDDDAPIVLEFFRSCTLALTNNSAIGLFVYEGAVYNGIFLALLLPALGKGSLVLPYALAFNASLGLAIWSFLKARYTDPGKVPPSWQEFVSHVGELLPIEPPRKQWQAGKATYCCFCGVPRPERAHHCKICGHCILRMDHHCPWLSNCVGFNNHKFFLLAVFYGLAVSCIGFFTTLPEFVSGLLELFHRKDNVSVEVNINLESPYVWGFLLFGVFASLLIPVLGAMFVAHLTLVCRNTTSIEGCYQDQKNPFEQNSLAANVAQLFGDFGPDWFLPIAPLQPTTDGVSFQRVNDGSGPSMPQRGRLKDVPRDQVWRIRYGIPGKAADIGEEDAQEVPQARSGIFRWWGNASPADTAEDRKGLLQGAARGKAKAAAKFKHHPIVSL